MIFCTACGTEADDQSLFCDQCGAQLTAALPQACPTCGRRNRATAHFCSACGTGLAAMPPAVVATPARPEAPVAPVVAEPVSPVAAEPVSPLPGPPDRVAPPTTTEPPAVDRPVADAPERAAGAAFTWGEPAEADAPEETRERDAAAATLAAEPGAFATPSGVPRIESDRQTPARAASDETRRPPPPPPGRPLGESAREWAASRQADILLYLGAFLLVAAALLFVSSQGDELSGGLRVGLLLVYTIGFTVAGLVARRTDRIREAGAVFLAIGALITPLNFVVIYTEILEPREISQEVVWLIGSLYSAVFYAVLSQRGYGRLYAVPAALAVISAWGALAAVLEIPGEWRGTWWVLFLVGVTAIADRFGHYDRAAGWSIGFFLSLVLIVQVLASDLFLGDDGRVPLAFSLGLITAWFALTGWSLRAPTLLPWGASVAIATGIAATRGSGLDADWAAYSPLTVGFLAVYTRRWWAHWHPGVSRLSWLYAAACGASPLGLVLAYETGAHGAVSFLLGAAVLGSITWRDRVDGVRLFEQATPGSPTGLAERTFFSWLGFVLLLIGIGYTQREFAIDQPDTGWIYVALSLGAIALVTSHGRRWRPALAVLIPPALLAMLVSLRSPDAYPGHIALYLGLPTIAFLSSFGVTRRWPITLVASVTGVFAAAAAWDALGWPAWTLAVAYSATGAVLFALLTRLRSYRLGSTATIAAILSWGFVLLGPLVAFLELLPLDDVGTTAVRESAVYRTWLYLLLVPAPLLAYEGWRFKNWNVTAAATTLAAVVIAPLWTSYGWPGWTLALAYLAIGILRFATMSAVRTYRAERGQITIVPLSWGLIAASPFTAWVALSDRITSDGGVAVEMVEYRAFIVGVFAAAALLLFDAQRLQARWALVSASVVGMTALLLTIAIFRFDDVQAYTVAVGIYWIAFGLIVRRSTQVLERHLMLHELVLLGGVAIILGPQVREGLQPDGAGWGGIVLLEGALFLLVGFLLGSRWLTVSGVLAISGVAIRWLADSSGDTIPYWLSLGGVGMLLLLLGTVLLLARDAWIAIKDATTAWWRRSATLRGVGIEWPVVLAPAAVAWIAIVVARIEDWVEPIAF